MSGVCQQLCIDCLSLFFSVCTVPAGKQAKAVQPFVHRHAPNSMYRVVPELRPQAVYFLVFRLTVDPCITNEMLDGGLKFFGIPRVVFPVRKQGREFQRDWITGCLPYRGNQLIEIHWKPQRLILGTSAGQTGGKPGVASLKSLEFNHSGTGHLSKSPRKPPQYRIQPASAPVKREQGRQAQYQPGLKSGS